MARPVLADLDFQNTSRIHNLPDGTSAQDPATVAQLNSAIEGLSWKDSARVSTQANLNLAAPGASIDGVTMVANDRVLVRAQTTGSENGIYVYNGAASPMTRAIDASTFAELVQAILTVEAGTNAGVTYRQTVSSGTLGSTTITWTTFGQATPAASETQAGSMEIATQGETDAGTDDVRAITPLKLANWSGRVRRSSLAFGDGSATSYVFTHNLNTRQITAQVFQDSGTYDLVDCEIELTTVNSLTVKLSAAPATNSLRINVVG